jgi:hypothetical protein
MKPKAILLLLGLILLVGAGSAAAQSLADIARATRAKHKSEKKPAHVYTTDDLSKGKASPGQSTDIPAPAAESGPPSSPESSEGVFPAVDRNGAKVEVAASVKTDLIFMGTWCPYSQQLKEMLNDARSHPYWAGRKLIFLFSNNEWSKAKAQLEEMAQKGKLAEADVPAALEELKHEAGSPYVIYPDFLNDLPGDAYFCPVPGEVREQGFPTILTTQGYVQRSDWLVDRLKMPVDLYNKVSDQYDPDKNSSSGP